jgi:V/A-type H+-transporting ATPase subunit D
LQNKVVPTKNNLINTQKSLALAKLGYDLMDRKRNILLRELMAAVDRAKDLRQAVELTFSEAYLALQNARITLGSCAEAAACVPLEEGLETDFRTLMGVELPLVKLNSRRVSLHYPLSTSNAYLDEAYLQFEKAKVLACDLAQAQAIVYRLADAIKKTQKRTNALENIIIPRFENDIKNISDALEEKEREEFSRLKVIKRQKEKSLD